MRPALPPVETSVARPPRNTGFHSCATRGENVYLIAEASGSVKSSIKDRTWQINRGFSYDDRNVHGEYGRMTQTKRLITAGSAAALVWCAAVGRAQPEPVAGSDLYRAEAFRPYEVPQELNTERGVPPWTFDNNDREQITHLSSTITEATVRDGAFRFLCGDGKVTVGWGNFEGRQPVEERISFFPDWNVVELCVRQSAARSK